MDKKAENRKRIVIFSRYNLADQYDLAPEFKGMLEDLCRRNKVMHLSFQGYKKSVETPPSLDVIELPVVIDRRSSRSILIDSMRMYLKLPGVVKYIRQFRPDVIFISEILPFVGLFFSVTCRTRIATAYGDWHFHNMLAGKWWSPPVLRLVEWLDRFECRRLQGFFCRASAAGDRVIRWGKAPDSVCVVRDAPDPTAYFPRDETALRRRCGFEQDDVVISYHGIMHSGKGLDKLIRWTAELHEKDPRIGLLLIGSGPEEKALREMAVQTGLGDHVFFTGWLETLKEVGDYCNASDINVAMRTKAEANDRIVPGALLHGMACRKVTVAPDLSGCAEIIEDGVNGLLFKADDGASFKAVIEAIIQHPERYSAIAEKGYADIQRDYSVQAASRKYAEAIKHFAELPVNS